MKNISAPIHIPTKRIHALHTIRVPIFATKGIAIDNIKYMSGIDMHTSTTHNKNLRKSNILFILITLQTRMAHMILCSLHL
jgi:hypothetical protein